MCCCNAAAFQTRIRILGHKASRYRACGEGLFRINQGARTPKTGVTIREDKTKTCFKPSHRPRLVPATIEPIEQSRPVKNRG